MLLGWLLKFEHDHDLQQMKWRFQNGRGSVWRKGSVCLDRWARENGFITDQRRHLLTRFSKRAQEVVLL